MPAASKIGKAKASAPAVKRSRSGCQTCRARKLKCDEVKPICGQCVTSHRECVPSEGITFRHHQNAALSRDGQGQSLNSFFKYKQAYSEDDLQGFLPVPQQLTWIHVSDPTADDTNATTPSPQTEANSDTYQQVAAHTLEALSTAAAADHTSYPPQGTAYYTAQTESNPEYGFVPEPGSTGTGPSPNMNYVLIHPSSRDETPSALIDPNLETTVAQAAEQAVGVGAAENPKAQDGDNQDSKEAEEGMADSDSRVAMALRTFNETPAG